MDNTPRRRRPERRRPVVIRRRRSRRRLRLRWSILWVLGALILAAWLVSGVRASFTWRDVCEFAGARDHVRYGQCAVIGCVVCAILAIARVLGYGERK